jgi:hypothetical protein
MVAIIAIEYFCENKKVGKRRGHDENTQYYLQGSMMKWKW